MKQKKTFLFIIHRIYSNHVCKKGGIDHILDYLAGEDNFLVDMIEHPFQKYDDRSVFTKEQREKIYYSTRLRSPYIWIWEIIINVWLVVFVARRSYAYGVASDPLNFLSIYVLSKIGQCSKTHFHSVDYSEKRFPGAMLNMIYHWIYRFSVNHADIVTVVTPRIIEKIRSFSARKDIFHLPNSPQFDMIKRIEPQKKDRYRLVLTAGKVSVQLEISRILSALEGIIKLEPRVTLHIVGDVDQLTQRHISQTVLQKNVVLYGMLPYNEAIEIVAYSSVGIVWYSKKVDHILFGDSLKIREYAAAGLPIISDDITDTAQEMTRYDAGSIIHNEEEMINTVMQLVHDDELYGKKRENAIVWAQKKDKKRIMREFINVAYK